MPYLHKKTNAVYFDEKELKTLFEASSRIELSKKILESGVVMEDIRTNSDKIKKILSTTQMLKDKEDIEIFTALYLLLDFYPGAKIGFPLKDSVDLNKTPIVSIEKLKELTKEDDLTDVYLLNKDGARAFQLKAYSGQNDHDKLFEFIKDRLTHYCLDWRSLYPVRLRRGSL